MLSPILIICESRRYQPIFIALNDLGIRAELVSSADLGSLAEANKKFAGIVLESGLSAPKCVEALKQIGKAWPDLPVIALGDSDAPMPRRKLHGVNAVEYLLMTGNEKADLTLLLDGLRRDSGNPTGERAVRAREGIVHGRHGARHGPGGRKRDRAGSFPG